MIDLRQYTRRRQGIHRHQMFVEPLPIGPFAGHRTLDLFVFDDAALLGIDQKHAPRLQTALAKDILRRDFQHPRFGGHDDQIVLGHVVARRPQAVAIKQGADQFAISKGNCCGPVPRFHETGVILVKGAQRIVHTLMRRPGLGDHHHHSVWQRAPCEHQQFERVVEHR